MTEREKSFLRDLQPVTDHFAMHIGTSDPVQDVIDRGVDPRALDEFIDGCFVTCIEYGVPSDQIWSIIARSCFHMGMLAQDYITVKGGDVQEEEAVS